MTAPYRFEKTGVNKSYYVFDRETGEKVGSVEQRSTHYNLARPFTVKWWQATSAKTGALRSAKYRDGRQQFDTRVLAAEALYSVYAEENH